MGVAAWLSCAAGVAGAAGATPVPVRAVPSASVASYGAASYSAAGSLAQASQSPIAATVILSAADLLSQGMVWDKSAQISFLHATGLRDAPSTMEGTLFMQLSQRTAARDSTPASTGTAALRYWQWSDGGTETQDYISKAQLGVHTLRLRAYYDTARRAPARAASTAYRSQAAGIGMPGDDDRGGHGDYAVGFGLEDQVRIGGGNRLQLAFSSKSEVHRENLIGQPVQTDRDRVQVAALDDTQALGERWTLAAGLSYQRAKMLREQYDGTGAGTGSDPVGSKSAWDGKMMLHLDLGDGDALQLGVVRHSRFATIKDRYAWRMVTVLANPDLQPETARRLEIGYAGWIGDWRAQLQLFHGGVRNLIQSSLVGNTISQPQNVARVAVDGLELSLHSRVGQLDMGGHYALARSANLGDDRMLTGAPRNKLQAYAALDAGGGWRLDGSVEASSMRHASSSGARRSSGFAIAGAKASYRLDSGLTLEAGVRNLFDRVYADTAGFPEPGRTGFVQLKHSL
jgi:iron complex outermembrane receptor protein